MAKSALWAISAFVLLFVGCNWIWWRMESPPTILNADIALMPAVIMAVAAGFCLCKI